MPRIKFKIKLSIVLWTLLLVVVLVEAAVLYQYLLAPVETPAADESTQTKVEINETQLQQFQQWLKEREKVPAALNLGNPFAEYR